MMRSLFSGVAGLRTHQTKMDVIGNNIANVNTVGYKANNVTFQELIYQTTSNASGANQETGRGGVNAKQIGLGVSTAAINTNITTAGASQTTNNPFDLQISGDSFFIVNGGGENFFTRAGAFYVDGAGNLAMTSNGYNVMGWQADPDTQTIRKDTVSALRVMSPENQNADPEATTKAYFKGIIDKNSEQLTSTEGLVTSISFYDNLGYSYVAKYSIKSTDTAGVYSMQLTDLVDSATNESVIKKNDGETDSEYQARKLTELPKYYSLDPADSDGKVYLHYNTTTGAFKGVNNSETTDITDEAAAKDPLTMVASTGTIASLTPFEIALDTTTMWDNNKTSTITGKPGDYDGNNMGRKVGKMSGLTVDQSGKIYASYDNGTQRILGQIAVATFENPSGLEKIGENLYKTTMNSGEFDGIGMDVTSDGVGKLTSGVLEMSNVDLSAEFTEMITTQRGFQANSRIITVSDSMLEELTNLKR